MLNSGQKGRLQRINEKMREKKLDLFIKQCFYQILMASCKILSSEKIYLKIIVIKKLNQLKFKYIRKKYINIKKYYYNTFI